MYQISDSPMQLRTEPQGPIFVAAPERSGPSGHTQGVLRVVLDGIATDEEIHRRNLLAFGGTIYRKADGAMFVDGGWIVGPTAVPAPSTRALRHRETRAARRQNGP